MDDPREIVKRHLGELLVAGREYHSPLPADVAGWYCYTADGGHSIAVLLAKDLSAAFEPLNSPADFLVPAPVKSVLRAYTVVNGYVVVDLPYSPDLGLQTEDEDDEY